jgi:hypothetical protein
MLYLVYIKVSINYIRVQTDLDNVECVNCFQLDMYNVYTYHDQILLNEEGTLTVSSRLSYHLQTAG